MNDKHAVDPIALLFVAVYCAAIGWFIGRQMLRNEQYQDQRMQRVWDSIYELQQRVAPVRAVEVEGPAAA